MKRIVLCLLLSLMAHWGTAQCIITGMNYLTEEENASHDITPTSEEDELPSGFLTTCNNIKNFFGVNCDFRIYNDQQTSGAKTYCSCTSAGCNSTVFVGKKLLSEYANGFSTIDGLWGIMAHELAHVLQCQSNLQLTGAHRELHADFLAGYFLGVKMKVQLTNIAAFSNELFKRGDFMFNSSQHHGTPQARVYYMSVGASLGMLTLADAYNYGINAVTGQLGAFAITGTWRSNNNPALAVRVYDFNNSMNMQFFNSYSGMPSAQPILPARINVNQYRLTIQAAPYAPVQIQDFVVINSNLILVFQNGNLLDILMRVG
jgi:hypothetical protein